MWPSERLASIGLDSWQRKSRARSRDRRGIRPIVTLLEGRALLSTVPITVTSLADSGVGTLRTAITTADAGSASNQYAIGFASGLTGTINLTEALPNLSNNISIIGPGASQLTINRLSTDTTYFSVLTIYDPTYSDNPILQNVSISGVTIEGGNVNTPGPGGGISNAGTLTVTNSFLTNNTSSYMGGGIENSGVLTVNSSTFSDNNASADGDIGGSGIFNDGWPLIVINSTFIGNTSGVGGGIYNDTNLATTTTVTNSTFTDNTNSGIYNIYGMLILNNTIVAGNTGDDIVGPVQFISSNNLIGNSTGITDLSSLNSTNLIGTSSSPINPDLGPLQNNGGPTQMMALLPGSPAIGTGSVALAIDASGHPLQYDQRGPGYPRITNGAVDIGAYEHQLLTLTVSVVDNGGTYNGTAFTATATVQGQSSLEGVTPTLDYQQYINGAWTDRGATAPVNAGIYEVTANFAGSTDYAAASSTVNFNIAQASASILVTPTLGLIYNGGPQVTATGTATDVNGVNLNSNLTINATHTNAGSYSDTWSFTDPTGNYAPETGTMTDNIAQATATVSVTPISGLVYNGGPLETASYSATGVGGVSLPSTDFTNTTVHTNAGTYNDTWTFTDPNYVSQTGSVTDNIAQATATIVVTPTPRLIYNGGSQQTAGYSATGVNGALPSTDFSDTTVHTNAGTYHDTWTFADPNYISQTGSVTDNIAQATATVEVVPTTGLIYNGSPQMTATGTATVVGGVNLSSDLTINSTHTNAGNYSDTWSFTDPTGNYAPETGVMTDTIGQATATVMVTSISGLVYNGGPQVTATGTATGVGGVNLSSDLTINSTHTNAGSYSDTWSFTDPTGNYAPETGTMTDNIAQATATIMVTPISGLVYNGGPQVTATGTATGVGGVNLSSDLTINSTHTNAGSYSDTWFFTDPTGNYTSEIGTMTDNIARDTATVSVTPISGLVYNGGPLETASYSATGVDGVSLHQH